MEGSYRFFDHTGDFGVDLEAPDQAGILVAFARAFLELLTDAPRSVGEAETLDVELDGVDPADLLVNLGNELIYLFEVEGFLCARLEPEEVGPGYLVAVLRGERFDPERHPIARPIKAVTHHGARSDEANGRVRARIVFDL